MEPARAGSAHRLSTHALNKKDARRAYEAALLHDTHLPARTSGRRIVSIRSLSSFPG